MFSQMKAFFLDHRRQNVCVLPGIAASLAIRSAAVLPGSSQCPGIHWRRSAINAFCLDLGSCVQDSLDDLLSRLGTRILDCLPKFDGPV